MVKKKENKTKKENEGGRGERRERLLQHDQSKLPQLS
jgi:hypothetical protein